ncbi:MAG TPA: cellulase family glycosylhydrolase [Actinophytocola sp.]|nr:cellulase family glycosylhydrolase [Actinophytocola sp.]
MKKALTIAVAALAALCSPSTAGADIPAGSERAPGFHISDGRLVEANGADFVLRGVNHAHTWFRGETGAFADIKALGANAVRVVLSSGHQWTENTVDDVANVVSLCKQNRLICVLEVHDTTGYGEQSAAVSLAEAVDYWLRVRDALVGQERYVLVNIGNEPFGNTNHTEWTQDTIDAIGRLRAGGFEHTLVVDAPNWGQDWSFTMRDNAASVFAADPARNTMFSVHMYGVFDTAAEITSYLDTFVSAGLPIMVGEFGHNHSDGDPDEDTILAATRARGLGYLGWSWSGNGGGVEYLDMVTGFDAGALTSWGQRIFHGPDGIRETAREATVYGGGDEEPVEEGCSAEYRVTGEWQDGFQAEVTVTNAGPTAVDGWRLEWTFDGGQRVTSMWHAAATQEGTRVVATNLAYNAMIPPGGSVTLGFTGSRSGDNPAPREFALNGVACGT